MRATCLFACVCVVYKAENGPRVPRELQDSTSLTGAVNSHSVKEPAFVCSLNYRAHLSWGFACTLTPLLLGETMKQ